MKNAFRLLMQGSCKSTPKKQKREYSNCALCGRSIPYSFLDLHTQSCLERASESHTVPISQQLQAICPSLPTDKSAIKASKPQIPLLTPVGVSQSETEQSSQIQDHGTASSHCQRAQQGQGHSMHGSGQGQTSQHQTDSDSSQQYGMNKGEAAGTGPSALHVLMQAQRKAAQQLQPQTHVFFLEWDGGCLTPGIEFRGREGDIAEGSRAHGAWRCYWWKAGPSAKPTQNAPDICSVSQGSAAHAKAHTTQLPNSDTLHPGQQQCSSFEQRQVPNLCPQHPAQQQRLPLSARPRSVPCWSATTVAKEKSEGKGTAGPGFTIVLQTNVPPNAGGPVDWHNTGMHSNVQTPPEGRWRGHPSAIKSALQKAVRRGMAPAACRLALQMLKEDPAELLRRLPIICLEDTTAHPTLLPAVVWLMCAQAKGYQLGALQASVVLEMTYNLACVGVRDHLPTHPPTLCPGRPISSLSMVDCLLPGERLQQEAVLVKAMILRANYGGMACDVEACKGYAQLWAARFSSTCSHQPSRHEVDARSKGTFCSVSQHPALLPPWNPLTAPDGATAGHAASPSACGSPSAADLQGQPQGHCQPHAQQQSHGNHQHHTQPHEVQQGSSDGVTHLAQQQEIQGHNCTQHLTQQPLQCKQDQSHGSIRYQYLAHQLQQPQQQPQQQHMQQLQESSQPISNSSSSAWFAYLCSLYNSLRPSPPELSCVAHVGALRRSDVPLAAIDFHVSDVVDHVLQVPQVAAAARSVCCASWGAEGDPVYQMRTAMWLFRSSVNHRAWLPLQVAANQVNLDLDLNSSDLVAYEHQPLLADLEQDKAQRDRLLPMWRVAEPATDRFASSLIAKRFKTP